MVGLDGNIMLNFDIVYPFEDGETMPDAGDAHLFQLIMLQHYENLANDVVFYGIEESAKRALGKEKPPLHTHEHIGVLGQIQACQKVGAFFCCPLGDDGSRGQAIWVSISNRGWRVLVGMAFI